MVACMGHSLTILTTMLTAILTSSLCLLLVIVDHPAPSVSTHQVDLIYLYTNMLDRVACIVF